MKEVATEMNRSKPYFKVKVSTIPSIVPNDASNSFTRALCAEIPTKIDSSSHDYHGPTAEFSDVATVVSFVADLTTLLGFIGGSLTLMFGQPKILKEFKALIRAGTPKDSESPPAFPVRVEFGTVPANRSVRFYFHGDPSEEDILWMWRSAQLILQSFPPEAFQELGGPPIVGYFWDFSSGQWRGSNYYEAVRTGDGYNGTWFPPDFTPAQEDLANSQDNEPKPN